MEKFPFHFSMGHDQVVLQGIVGFQMTVDWPVMRKERRDGQKLDDLNIMQMKSKCLPGSGFESTELMVQFMKTV